MTHRERHKSYYLKHEAKRRQQFRELLRVAKDRPCADCGQRFPPYVMDFDHRDPTSKRFRVSEMGSRNLAVFKTECEKCDVVCANCHRIRTHSTKAALV